MVKVLLENGAEPNSRNDEGFTALQLILQDSQENENLETIKILVENNALVNN